MPWLYTAWSWVKKNWKWLLFPLGILLYVVGKMSASKSYEVLNPELTDAENERREALEEKEEKDQLAREERDERLKEVDETHRGKIDSLTKEQADRALELKDDPEALNKYLLQVGKDTKG